MGTRATYGFGLICLALCSTVVTAQQTGSIAGSVTDTSGAVMPGVTAEASSPALIEKVRTVVTDARGLYQIVDLPPGVYAVTFTLAGFNTIRRDGIALTTGFSANVPAQMAVGNVRETVNVTASTPVVDIQNVNQQDVLTREVIDQIPSGKGWSNLVPLVPGVVMNNASSNGVAQDVGGATGFNFTMGAIHGGHPMDEQVVINGMTVASLTGPGESRTNWSDGLAEEYNIELAGHPADVSAYGGLFMNLVPKEGSNRFSGSLYASFGTPSLQANNLDSVLKNEGLTVASPIKDLADINPAFGGPILQDRLWFYTQYRYYRADTYVSGMYYNADPTAWVFSPDPSRPALNDQRSQDPSVNVTWRISPKNKVTALYAYELMCLCHFGVGPTTAPEASTYNNAPSHLVQGTWTSTINSRLLLSVGGEYYSESFLRQPEPDATQPSILEQSTNIRFRSGASYSPNPQTITELRGSLSYITGGHSLKVGFDSVWENAEDPTTSVIDNVNYRTLNGVPNQATFWTTPYPSPKHLYPVDIYAQDQLRLKRLTIDAGLRFDRFTSNYEAVNIGPTQYTPVARNYPAAQVLDWKDLSPRLGAAYDLFGNGKTAIKASVSRYVAQEGVANTNSADPILAATNSVTRTWNDANHDFIVQGDPLNPKANGELGPSPNNLFGTPNTTFSLDPAWANGWHTRPFNWTTAVTVQQELAPRVGLEASFNRRIAGNFILDDNVLVNPGAYDPYCITGPVDPRLPGGGGQQICGLYDLNPKYFGQVQTVRTSSAQFGNQYDHWTDFGVSLQARFAKGVLIQGGVDSGKQTTDDCDVVTKVNNPSTYQCHQESPFLTQLKILASYPIPWWGLQASGAFQSRIPDPTGIPTAPGTPGFDVNNMGMSANYVASNAQIAPSLGRNLSAGAGSNVTVNVIPPGALYPHRVNQLDLRLAKKLDWQAAKIQVFADIFNIFNSNTGLRFNNTYGTTGSVWNNPTAIMPPRLIRLGAQLRF